jgi:hypothetical protein
MHNLFLVYFVILRMFQAYLGLSSGRTTVCIQYLVLIILFRWLSVVLVGLELSDQDNSHLKRTISTNCCIHVVVPPDDKPRYARNMRRMMKYTKNKLCIKLVFLYVIISRCTVSETYGIVCKLLIFSFIDIVSNLFVPYKQGALCAPCRTSTCIGSPCKEECLDVEALHIHIWEIVYHWNFNYLIGF